MYNKGNRFVSVYCLASHSLNNVDTYMHACIHTYILTSIFYLDMVRSLYPFADPSYSLFLFWLFRFPKTVHQQIKVQLLVELWSSEFCVSFRGAVNTLTPKSAKIQESIPAKSLALGVSFTPVSPKLDHMPTHAYGAISHGWLTDLSYQP